MVLKVTTAIKYLFFTNDEAWAYKTQCNVWCLHSGELVSR